ncbi:hypothetical protein [Flavobacterium notoginsengisoli]|uniref:hypothetical protein n=1 Tax=Flavobacterium notoginsengisoli TaxID=1478199 RepID=UPI0036404047
MTQIIIISLFMMAIGAFIYIRKYKESGKPKVGVKRNNLSEYYNDYSNIKLYWSSIGLFFFGLINLIVILILELIF